ncbi:hypothetical protein [Erwinia billingiae]|uniref:hypothetical protein n=1 Tax=Erwinia billingiae TaxID=182337 RepID=UPI0005A17F9E|nr:hypothetical protein [Erwinia billingiae]
MYTESYQNFLVEASLASSSIRGGLTSLNKCTITDKGTFYASFFQLSIGLERFFKIIYILQYMIDHDLKKPDFKEIRSLGHDIKSLYKAVLEVGKKHSKGNDHLILNEIQTDIINMLSEFGDQSRYYVLNTITNSKKKTPNPLELWNNIIESAFWEYIPPSKRDKIVDDAIRIVDRSGKFTYSQFFSLDGYIMSEVDFIVINWKVTKLSPYLAAEIVAILYPYYDILCKLRSAIFRIDQSKGSKEQPIPFIEELFPYLLTPYALARKRRNWLK